MFSKHCSWMWCPSYLQRACFSAPDYGCVDGFQGSMPPMPGGPQQMHAGQSHMPGGMVPGMQTMSQPGSPAGGQPGSASRIDPNQIPRPQSMASPLQFDTRVNGSANLPPVLHTQSSPFFGTHSLQPGLSDGHIQWIFPYHELSACKCGAVP